MDIVKQIEFEMEIKAGILTDGIRYENAALEGVGTKYQEDSVFVFNYNMARANPMIPPYGLRFPCGTIVKTFTKSTSPYVAKREDGTLFLEKDGKFLTTIEWWERPKFYDRFTSDGVAMNKIGTAEGKCGLAVCLAYYCSNWENNEQCRFCNMTPSVGYNKKEGIVRPNPRHIGEVAAAFLEERGILHLILTTGILPDTMAEDACVAVLEAIKEQTGLEKVPSICPLGAPQDLKQIDRLHKAGLQVFGLNLEVWNPDLFKYMCPGKARKVGRDQWLRAIEYAVSVFGRGYAYSAFVAGIEDRHSLLEGNEYLASMGCFPLIIPWIPVKTSYLENHRPPSPDWILDITAKNVDILAKYLPFVISEEYLSQVMMPGCADCCGYILHLDEIRKRLGGATMAEMRKPLEEQVWTVY